jgi:hypothetical protein
MGAQVFISITHLQCGNYAAVNELGNELFALADEKGARLWKALGMIHRGFVLDLTGKASDAVHMITSGITASRSSHHMMVFVMVILATIFFLVADQIMRLGIGYLLGINS